jgi:hypothetical protein
MAMAIPKVLHYGIFQQSIENKSPDAYLVNQGSN